MGGTQEKQESNQQENTDGSAIRVKVDQQRQTQRKGDIYVRLNREQPRHGGVTNRHAYANQEGRTGVEPGMKTQTEITQNNSVTGNQYINRKQTQERSDTGQGEPKTEWDKIVTL